MYHNGYAMVDCTGPNLNTSSEQTITSADKVTVTNLVAG